MYHDTESRGSNRQAKKLHGDNITWSMTYSQTQTLTKSNVVNVPRHYFRKANNCTWRQIYGVRDILKDKYMDAK